MLIWLSAAQCDFESDSCGWHELIQGDGFEWVRDSTDGIAMEYKDQTPPQDHSTNTSAGEGMKWFCLTFNLLSLPKNAETVINHIQ